MDNIISFLSRLVISSSQGRQAACSFNKRMPCFRFHCSLFSHLHFYYLGTIFM